LVLYHKEAWYDKGNALYNLNRYEEAIECYEKALKTKPEYKEAWYEKGNALHSLNRYEEAIECFEKALEIYSEYEEAWAMKGLSLQDLHRYDEANQCYDEALKIDINYEMVWYNKACIESLRNNKEKSIEFLKKAIEIDNENINLAKTDGDFDNVKDTKEFKELIF